MSDQTNSYAIGIWCGFVGIQIGTAIYDGWKIWRESRRQLTGFEKVKKGETIDGWHVAIPRSSLHKKHRLCLSSIVHPSFSVNSSDYTVKTPSLLRCFEQRLPNGPRELCLTKFSSNYPDVSATIFRIIFKDGEWEFQFSCYLTDRLIAVVFEFEDDPRLFRLVFVDLIEKSHRVINIASPIIDRVNVWLRMIYHNSAKHRLNVLFTARHLGNGPPRREFHEVSYEIPVSPANIDVPLRSSVWKSVSIPIAIDFIYWDQFYLYPPMAVIPFSTDGENIDDYQIVTFDQIDTWRLDKLSNWSVLFRSSLYGSKLMNAVDSFAASTASDGEENWSNIPPLKYFYGSVVDGSLLRATNYGPIIQRYLYPPTLKSIAAKKFCQSNPKFDFSILKKEIGFDIFDGLLENDLENSSVIYL